MTPVTAETVLDEVFRDVRTFDMRKPTSGSREGPAFPRRWA